MTLVEFSCIGETLFRAFLRLLGENFTALVNVKIKDDCVLPCDTFNLSDLFKRKPKSFITIFFKIIRT